MALLPCFVLLSLLRDVEIGTVVYGVVHAEGPTGWSHCCSRASQLPIVHAFRRYYELGCSHVLAGLIQSKCPKEFRGTSLDPRWRHSLEEWNIMNAGLRMFDGQGLGPSGGGFTDHSQTICRVWSLGAVRMMLLAPQDALYIVEGPSRT